MQGVSTRKVKAITEELCGHEFSASAISRINASLDEELDKFASRKLDEEYACLIVDARYERIREDGVIRSQAVLVAIEGQVKFSGAEVTVTGGVCSQSLDVRGISGGGKRKVLHTEDNDPVGPNAPRLRIYYGQVAK